MVVKGYDNWLTKDRLLETEAEWAQMDRSKVLQKILDFEPKTVVEFCCGTGWIPLGLPIDTEYLGIDANAGCIHLAAQKDPTREFLHLDILEGYLVRPPQDMALAFSCLKHFTLADWDRVYGTVLEAGNVTLCSVYIADADREDKGYDYPHTAVSRERLDRVVAAHGHEILDILVMPPLVGPKEPLVLTQRVNRHIDTFMADDTESEDFLL